MNGCYLDNCVGHDYLRHNRLKIIFRFPLKSEFYATSARDVNTLDTHLFVHLASCLPSKRAAARCSKEKEKVRKHRKPASASSRRGSLGVCLLITKQHRTPRMFLSLSLATPTVTHRRLARRVVVSLIAKSNIAARFTLEKRPSPFRGFYCLSSNATRNKKGSNIGRRLTVVIERVSFSTPLSVLI